MTTTDIMMRDLNNDLSMYKTWSDKFYSADKQEDIEYYRGCMLRSRIRAEAKEDLILSLGYTVLFNDERDECIAIYPMELDD